MGYTLKPCPLCGGRGILYEIGKEGHVIQCESCGLTTPKEETRVRVEQIWNGKVRIKTWSKAVIPWNPLRVAKERDFSKGTLDYKSELAAVKIEMLDMSSRLYYSLRRGGVETIGDLLLKSPGEIKGFTQLGVKGYKELTGKLKDVLEKDVYDEWMRR